ncbi:hypothetical protein QBC47DRAFT_174080 [Echria macrotheca]|uniref:Uncharacterized protein n=1 Tax=Echria macrotheca TaxID=438768 RepID=A0AAJ0BHK9_9PEZI|nr:hypothetical protein QBC47DRAFT_174080 [Echria macrotheca]
MSREEQYTTNKETDLYISRAAEDSLDEGNPFITQPFSPTTTTKDTELITDPDEAAVAALLSRDTESDGDAEGDEDDDDDDGPNYVTDPPATGATIIRDEENVDRSKGITGQHDEYREFLRMKKRSRDSPSLPAAYPKKEEEEDHLAKRARHGHDNDDDDRDPLIEPGDDVEDEEAKMRGANLIRNGIFPASDKDGDEGGDEKDEDGEGDEEEEKVNPVEEVSVEPVPLMDQKAEGKKELDIPGGGVPRPEVGDVYDDVEAKRDDDYDPGDYARFEDDDEGTGEVVVANGGVA